MRIPLNHENATYIATHLRDSWKREVASGLVHQGKAPGEFEAWAAFVVESYGPRGGICIATADGVPAMMGGFLVNGTIARSWLCGTERASEVGVEFAAASLREHRILAANGVEEFHALCLDGPQELFHWLAKLGYACRAKYPGIGMHKEDYVLYVKEAKHVYRS